MNRFAAPLLLLVLAACSTPDQPAAQVAAPAAPPASAPPKAAAPDTALQRFSWEDDVCLNVGYFPAGRYTEQQLRDTRVLVTFPFASSSYNESVHRIEQLHPDSIGARLQRLERQHRQEQAALQALQVVPLRYWQNLKKLRLGEEAEFYQMSKLMLEAYLVPRLLLTAPGASKCQRYVQALASADTLPLLQAWREQVDEHKKNNGAPQYLEDKYQQQYASPDRLRYARLDLMLYGWWNCANHHRQYVDIEEEQQPWPAFEKLFVKVARQDCADVD